MSVGVLKPGIAIPTEFRGTTYRSRLEANVAQFLCDLGLKFAYESTSFLINGKHYSPDFYLLDMDRYVEVRGYETETSEATLEAFVRQQGDLFVFYSNRAEQIEYNSQFDEIHRNEPLPVCVCSRVHASFGTLGYPSSRDERGAKCWVCKEWGYENKRELGYFFIVMRSGVPVMVCENAAHERGG